MPPQRVRPFGCIPTFGTWFTFLTMTLEYAQENRGIPEGSLRVIPNLFKKNATPRRESGDVAVFYECDIRQLTDASSHHFCEG